MFKSLLPFVLAALVLDGAAHPVLDAHTALSVPMMPNAISHGAALPLPLRRQEQGDEEEEDQANSTSKRPSHRKPRPSNDDKQNTTLPVVHVPRSANSTNATLPMHVVPRSGGSSHNSTLPLNLPRSSKNSTTSPLPIHVVPRSSNSTMPVQNSTMPLDVAQKNGTTHLHASRSHPSSSSSSGTNSTKPAAAAPVHIGVGPRSSTHLPADALLPHHPRRATVETHVPAEKVTHLVSGHHRRQEQGGDNDEYSDTKDTPSDTKPATPILAPRHSTGVAVADTILHSGPHMPRQSHDDEAESDC